MEKLTQCPYCQSREITKILETRDYFLTKERFDIDKCESCCVHFTNPSPDQKTISKYYKSDSYISHGRNSITLITQLYTIARKITLRWKINIINNLSEKGNILDYGCGTGDFLKAAQASGWKVAGIEPSEVARAAAEQNIKQKIAINLNEISTEKYNLISLWHVLEHVPNLNDLLTTLNLHLKAGGRLIIAVPNHESYDAKKFGEHWAAYDVPRHLWHFDKNTLTKILQNASFEVEQIVPMKLDAYYISLLSHNYKKGTHIVNTLSALWDGLVSNKKAKKLTNHSSLIYIARLK